eukprot:5192084-Lingulodinium_polyedra.AAC.1
MIILRSAEREPAPRNEERAIGEDVYASRTRSLFIRLDGAINPEFQQISVWRPGPMIPDGGPQ